MMSIKEIAENPEIMKQAVKNKGLDVDVDRLLEIYPERNKLREELDAIRQKRNELSASISGKPSEEQISAGKKLREEASEIEDNLKEVEAEYLDLLGKLPNLPSDDTPTGNSEDDNEVLREVGEKPVFDFKPRAHWDIGKDLGLIDSESAGKVSGSRFAYIKGELALMQFALINLAMSVLVDQKKLEVIAADAGVDFAGESFTPVIPPVMLRPEVMQRMARLEPRDERYHIPSDDLFLVGSAEHTLGPLHMDEVLREEDLPKRYVGYSTAFRRESGSHGKDVRGILRLHQFDKIEIESFTTAKQSLNEQNLIVAIQEHLMQLLEVPYQVVLKCTADMGAPDFRAIDIETWMPGQDLYRETHTSDHMSDFQSRRLRTKVKLRDGRSEYVHMNDATVFAIGRTLIAIMENHQQKDGSVKVPKALHPYLPFDSIESQ